MLFLYFAAGIVGLIWGLVLLIRGNLVAGCLAYLPLTCCLGTYFWQIALDPDRTEERKLARRSARR